MICRNLLWQSHNGSGTGATRGVRSSLVSCLGIAGALFAYSGGYAADPTQDRASKYAILGSRFGRARLQVLSLAFAGDGKRLAVAYKAPSTTCVWDVESGAQLTTVAEEEPGESLEVQAVRFSPDGKLLAVGIELLLERSSEMEVTPIPHS